MRKIEDILNKLLVQLFNDILQIEEKSLRIHNSLIYL